MKFVILAIFVLVAVFASFSEAALSDIIMCPTTLSAALGGSCKNKLEERLELVEKAEKDIDQVAPSMFRCCYFAEFVHCVTEESKPSCGEEVSKMVEERVTKLFSTISGKCQDYTYSSPQCVLVVWFNTILSLAIILGILFVGCCIGACLC